MPANLLGISTIEDLAEHIARRCEEAHPYQNGWRARCPAHQGKTNTSLSIEPSTDRVLVHCHGDCAALEIVTVLGLTLADLFLADSSSQRTHERIVRVYDYYDAQGVLQHQTVRFEPKKFRQRRPDPAHPGTDIWNLKNITPVLYHLPQVLQAIERGETIYLCEGEKDADALIALGLTATCNAMGAGAWRKTYTEALRKAHVVIFPDHDEPGLRHAQRVANALEGVAADCKIILGLHMDHPGSDISDWLVAGGTREGIESTIQNMPWYTATSSHNGVSSHSQPSPQRGHHPTIVSLENITTEDVAWLWWPYLALGTLAMLDGEPGVGKSLLSVTLAAILSQGWPLPDQQGGLTSTTEAPSVTLLMNAEDSLANTIRPRLDAVGADCTRVVALTGWHADEDAPEEQRVFTLEHIPVLESALQQCQPRLVIIDPIQAYLGGKIDINRANETRPLLTMLGHLAERYRCAMVLVRHPAKGGQGRAIHRGLGSIDFIGAARTALFVEQHPLRPDAALLCQTKNNLGPLGRTQIFTKEDGEFHWHGVSRVTAEMLAGSGRGPDPGAFLEAVFWLEQRLEGGLSWPSTDIEEEGLGLGHKKDTLRRAKKALGVVSHKMSGAEGVWTWRLEPLALVLQHARATRSARMANPVTSVSSFSSHTTTSTTSSHLPGWVSAENGLKGQDGVVREEKEVSKEKEDMEVYIESGVERESKREPSSCHHIYIAMADGRRCVRCNTLDAGGNI